MSSDILSLIVARANSKQLPNKNILLLDGKKVFEYSLDYSRELEKIYPIHTVVSTDSNAIIDYCKKNNIDYINRDKSLAKDDTKIEDVVYDAYKKLNKNYKYISIVYADLPTRYIQEFIKAYSFLENEKDYDCAISYTNVRNHPEYMSEKTNDELIKKKTTHFRKQDLKEYIIYTGHTLLFKSKYFIEYINSGKKVNYLYEQFGNKIKPIMTDRLITSINDKRDFELAKAIIRNMYDNS